MIINIIYLMALFTALIVYAQREQIDNDLKDINIGVMIVLLIGSLVSLIENGDVLNVLHASIATFFAFCAKTNLKN